MLIEFILGVFSFTAIVVLLALGILFARSRLVQVGNVQININGDLAHGLHTKGGDKLLQTLSDNDIFLSSACGGGGTCGQCKCQVIDGGGSALPVEVQMFSPRELRDGWRLACQLPVKRDMSLKLPEDVFGARAWKCKVRSNENVATFIKELILELPEGENVDFRAGGYVQLECPPYDLDYHDIDVQPEYRPDWDRFGVWDNRVNNRETVIRAYSMANYPEEKGILKFNIRIATPPPGSSHPPGIMSSWVFGLRPGDEVNVFGPFGEFFARETSAEMIFVGGGAGMAPMRAHIFDQLRRLNSKRKISFWYGARSLKEMFYSQEYDQLAQEHDNFKWYPALSEPLPEDQWQGKTGFIHQVLLDSYLTNHPSPEECEYYICGPPMMNTAVINMLQNLGVEDESILFDDFG
ncbi:MAG: NADH:ubiquinone reductase (Na(+)-transporting) subunit F [Gammaproteobacteria bacterium]